jgi:predicted nucleic acid-binding protein
VPAVERAFGELPPQHLYVDTNVYLAHLVATHPQHAQAQALFLRLATAGLTTLYLSPLVWTEFLAAVCHRDVLRLLPAPVKQQLNLQQWSVFRVQRGYRRHMLAQLEELLEAFAWVEVPLTPEVRVQALQYLDTYYLDPNDAIYLASATVVGVHDFASFDRAFRPVAGLSLWNNRLHRGSPPGAPTTE